MEQGQGQDATTIDKNKVLTVKPLRCLVPVFPSSPNLSSFSAPQGSSPVVYASPYGPFPPGVAPFYPLFGAPETGEYPQYPSSFPNQSASYNTPISNAVPINSYRTPPTANGDAGQSSQHVSLSSGDTGKVVKRRGRPPKKMKNTNDSDDVEVEALISNILASFNLAVIDESRRVDGDRVSVMFVHTVYDFLRRKITQLEESKEAAPGAARRSDLRAGTVMMNKGFRTNSKKRIGAVPGIEVGDIFFFRMELCVVGLHAPSMAGIDYMSVKLSQEEEPLAVSIVSSGGYEDNIEDGDVLIYSGQGGNNDIYNKNKEVMDQKLERGNLALEKSSHRGNEVRVIRGIKDASNATGKIYVYDGLYKIQESWIDKGKSGCNMFKYKLIRAAGQPPAFTLWQSIQMWKDGLSSRPGTILPDLTSGAESLPVSLVNDVDGEKGPAYFTYVPSLKYTKLVKLTEPPVSCSCTGGCLPSNRSCPCVQKNGGYLPYNVTGILVNKRSMVYECGPSCQCPPSCRNRVSQTGLKFRLEVFKTKDKGWGLRSWDPIRAGAYICEYAGEVIDVYKMKELGVDNGYDYVFDGTRVYHPLEFLPPDFNQDPKIPFPLFISAKNSGNVARFMNHSCSPNVFWQPVLRGNKNECDLHIVFHAIGHIPPMVELTYDYGIVQSRGADQRERKCLCGSEKCRGYFY